MRSKHTTNNIFRAIDIQVAYQHHKLRQIHHRQLIPTLPAYNHALFLKADREERIPQEATPGQIVRDAYLNYSGYRYYSDLWIFGEDGKWHGVNTIARARMETRYSYAEIPIVKGEETLIPMSRRWSTDESIMDFVRAVPGASVDFDSPYGYAYCIRIKKGGYYTLQFQANMQVTVGVNYNYDKAEQYTTIYHPDYDYRAPYKMWHKGVSNYPQGQLSFVVPENVAETDTPGEYGPHPSQGKLMYLTVTIPTTTAGAWFIGETHFATEVDPGAYADCFLEVIRMGGVDTEDITPASYLMPDPDPPPPPLDET